MRRRQFISLLGAVAADLPLVAQAQQAAIPVVGTLRNSSAEASAQLMAAFRQGLSEGGFAEGRTVAIESRWAQGQYARLPDLAAELVRLGATVIFAGGTGETLAVKAATKTIPIVFTGASDPVDVGLVASLNRPGGNLTGYTMIAHSLGTKRLELLRQLVPKVSTVGLLMNPNNPSAEAEIRLAQEGARAIGLAIVTLRVSTEQEFDAAFTAAVQKGAGALVVAGDPFFTLQHGRIAAFARQYKLPSIYSLREYAVAGGLVSYGTSFAEAYRQCGGYVARILKGEKPGDLPVLQPTRFEFVINLKTAHALGLTVPPSLLATADEVIE